jgi:ABC-type sugar transport system ATPase subunit
MMMLERYALPISDLRALVGKLSGGQQKAVAIGRALLSSPQMLLLDEPTAGLGVREQAIILRTIGELKSEGSGIMFCTHSPDEILAVADRVLVLRRGELVDDRSLSGVTRSELAILMSS